VTRRLLISYAAFALAVLIGLELPLGILGARRYRSLSVDQTEKVATALAVAANADFEAGRSAALQALVARYRVRTGGEVAIVDGQDVTVASADDDGDDDAHTVDRGYVKAALDGGVTGAESSDEGDAEIVAAAPIGDTGAGDSGAVLVSVSARPTENRIHLYWLGLVGLAVAVLAAALVIGWWLARTVTRPLANLGLTVTAFGQPDLGARADERHGPSEVSTLARQFNLMADQLRELVEAQNRFVADASHQLRSPLAALRLRIENLEADIDPSRAGTIRALDAELQRLTRLVDGLINLGNAESAAPTPVPVAIDQVLRERAEVWSALADERGVTLDLSGLTGSYEAPIGDGDLDQMLDNLLANALDASPAGSRISIGVSGAGAAGAVASVADEGPGMTDEQLARAFDRFWRGGDRASSAGGLGLSIVRQLAVRNGLVVELTRRPGGGIEATVQAPRARRTPTTRMVPDR
jgi:signal transduction histidine kinase